jgi:hypothetical protein
MTEIIDNRSIVYQSEDGALKLPMTATQNSVWLCLSDIAKLFGIDKKLSRLCTRSLHMAHRMVLFQVLHGRDKLSSVSLESQMRSLGIVEVQV